MNMRNYPTLHLDSN